MIWSQNSIFSLMFLNNCFASFFNGAKKCNMMFHVAVCSDFTYLDNYSNNSKLYLFKLSEHLFKQACTKKLIKQSKLLYITCTLPNFHAPPLYIYIYIYSSRISVRCILISTHLYPEIYIYIRC
jgi:hypothetical protein